MLIQCLICRINYQKKDYKQGDLFMCPSHERDFVQYLDDGYMVSEALYELRVKMQRHVVSDTDKQSA